MLPSESLHLLTIDFETASPVVREALNFSPAELEELLRSAGASEIPLVLIPGEHCLHLVSTSRNHVRAFRPVLARVQERIGACDGSRQVPVQISRGGDAARQILRRATPFSGRVLEAHAFVRALRAAGERARACGSFSAELAALFDMTAHAARRVEHETHLGRPGSTEAELELEGLDAERIVEEELLAWQSSYPAARSSLRPPISEHDIQVFSSEEATSVVRLKPASVLTKLRAG